MSCCNDNLGKRQFRQMIILDRFMSEARALVNVIGCFVATIVVATWEGEFDLARARAVLADRENYDRTSEAARPSPHDFACSRHTDR
jgi:hypothetical protein